MPRQRPHECPACGHECPRRVYRAPRRGWKADESAADRWICGLCRYEWSVPIDRPASMKMPLP